MMDKNQVTVETTIEAPLEKVWTVWTSPEHIIHWNTASEDWMTSKTENDLRVGGKFLSKMEAKDGSFSFDFEGIYDEVDPQKLIVYTLADGRKVTITFTTNDEKTTVKEVFDAEETHPTEVQQAGWQSILNNFKSYTESL